MSDVLEIISKENVELELYQNVVVAEENSVAFWGCEVPRQQTVAQQTRILQEVTGAEACC